MNNIKKLLRTEELCELRETVIDLQNELRELNRAQSYNSDQNFNQNFNQNLNQNFNQSFNQSVT